MQHRSARRSPWYIASHIAFLACIVFQRFGIHIGDSSIALSVPVILGLTIYLFIAGEIVVDGIAAFLFAMFIVAAAVSTFTSIAIPDSRAKISILSMLELLAVYGPFLFENKGRQGAPVQARARDVVSDTFLFYMHICAWGGIAQFFLQYVGIQIFSLRRIIPSLDPILLEKDFNTDAVVAYGSEIRRSNGLFMLEPSFFSQFLAVAILIEMFGRRRPSRVALFGLAYMTSYSGTGLLALAITFLIVSPTSLKNLSLLIYVSVAGLAAALVFAFLLPDLFAIFTGRFTEIGSAGSSGNARFMGPLEIVRQFGWSARSFIGYGPGATARSVFYVEGSGNTALQLFVDYGLIGAVIFAFYVARGVWTPGLRALSIILLVDLEFGGGLLLFTPYSLLMLALGRWTMIEMPCFRRRQTITGHFSSPIVVPTGSNLHILEK